MRTKSPSDIVRATNAALASPDAVGGALALREDMLARAGYTLEEQARDLRIALAAAQHALQATKVQRLVHNTGLNTSDIAEFVDIDHATRLRAADVIFDITGIKLGKRTENLNVGGNLTVNVIRREPPVTVDASDVRVIPD